MSGNRAKRDMAMVIFWPALYSAVVCTVDWMLLQGRLTDASLWALGKTGFVFLDYMNRSILFDYMHVTLSLTIFTCFVYVAVVLRSMDLSRAPHVIATIKVWKQLAVSLVFIILIFSFYLTSPEAYTSRRSGFVEKSMSNPIAFYITHIMLMQMPLAMIALSLKIRAHRLASRR